MMADLMTDKYHSQNMHNRHESVNVFIKSKDKCCLQGARAVKALGCAVWS